MNLHAPPLFVPPRPEVPTQELGWYETLAALRTNALQMWPQAAYEKDLLVQSFLGRKRFQLNAPDAIHHVLVDNAANYTRTPATFRILGPIIGNGLVLSEGEEWRHQRRTIAPALAPRIIPMLTRHVAAATATSLARLAACADGPAVDDRTFRHAAGPAVFSRHGAAARHPNAARPGALAIPVAMDQAHGRDHRGAAAGAEERRPARSLRRAARRARSGNRRRLLARAAARSDGDHDRCRSRDDGIDAVLVALSAGLGPRRAGTAGARPARHRS